MAALVSAEVQVAAGGDTRADVHVACIGSHGCLGLSLADSKWLWDWSTIGTPVVVNP
jgi:hypothetical protein